MAMRRFATLGACVVLMAAPAAARAGSFLDPDARLFTLHWPHGPSADPGRLRALPDGSVIFASPISEDVAAALWRLRLDGRIERLAWAGPTVGDAVDRRGNLVLIRPGSTVIERLDLRTRRRSIIADLARAGGSTRPHFSQAALLAGLDDGAVVVSD